MPTLPCCVSMVTCARSPIWRTSCPTLRSRFSRSVAAWLSSGLAVARMCSGALLFEPREVVGFELNEVLVDDLVRGRLRDFAGGVYEHPAVSIVVGDARAELSRVDGQFDLILANSVATWAAHSAGAMSLTEQGLFTDRAFALYRDKLTPEGILSISLWDEAEHSLPLRAVTTWRAALAERGVSEIRDHVAVVGNRWKESRWFTTILLSVRPFTPPQRRVLSEVADRSGFDVLYLPGAPARSSAPFAEYFEDPEGFVRRYRYDVTPATDDRPFFFYHAARRGRLALAGLRARLGQRGLRLSARESRDRLDPGRAGDRVASVAYAQASRSAIVVGSRLHVLRSSRWRLHAGRDPSHPEADACFGASNLRLDRGVVRLARLRRARQPPCGSVGGQGLRGSRYSPRVARLGRTPGCRLVVGASLGGAVSSKARPRR